MGANTAPEGRSGVPYGYVSHLKRPGAEPRVRTDREPIRRSEGPYGDDPRVATALHRCAEITRRHSQTFTLGARLFPAAQRSGVTAVYAVCRTGDDAVDEAPDPRTAGERLDAWWASVRAVYDGAPDLNDPLQCALAWTVARWNVPLSAFAELHEGLKTDLRQDRTPGQAQVRTLDELLLYCHRVGGVVGAMIVPIAGHENPERALPDAWALGQAMQLTNVLRDVGEDLRERDRCYLPQEWMDRYGVDRGALRRGELHAGYVALLDRLAGVANDLYARGWRSVPGLHGRTAYAVGLAALSYQGIGHALRRNGYDNLSRRAHLSGPARLARVPSAVLRVQRGRFRRSWPFATSAGDASRSS